MNLTKLNALAIAIASAMVPAVSSSQEEVSIVLEELVVTAQRRDQLISDVPISISVISEDFLGDNDVRTLEDLNGTIPGFYATNSVNYGAAPLTIRGIGGTNGGGNVFNDEPVAVYVDDVYLARLSFSTADLIDVESIQILRGPQGTLYGRNSTAGALLLRTNRPTNETEGHIKVGVAQYGEVRLSGAASGALSDSVQARLALGYSEGDGWANNTFDGSDLASSESKTARLSLRYSPTNAFTADLILEQQDREAAPATIAVASLQPLTLGTPFTRRSDLNQLLDDDNFAINDPNSNESETSSATLLLNWELGWAALDSVTAYRSYDVDGAQDSDGTQFTLFNNTGLVGSDQFSQEVRLSNSTDNLSWVAGAYYLTEDADLDFTINNFQGLFGPGTSAKFDASQSTDAWAVFADATWSLSDKLELLLGARYSDETKEFNNNQTVTTIRNSIPLPFPIGSFPVGGQIPGGIPFAPPASISDEADFSDFTPRVVLNYKFNNDFTGYARYSQSYKSGGFNSFGFSPAFENEEIDAIEFGFKGAFNNGRAILNGAVFSYDYTNLQVRLPVPTGGVSIQNAGEASINGAELELQWAASDKLKISANVTYLDTKLDEFLTQEVPQDLQFLIGAPIPLNSVNAAGNDLTRAPDLQYFISADYSFSLNQNLNANFMVNYRHQDQVFLLETNQNSNAFRSDSSDEVGVRLTIFPASEGWELGIYGQNITDERTITQIAALGAYPNAAINEPAKWGIDFRKNFQIDLIQPTSLTHESIKLLTFDYNDVEYPGALAGNKVINLSAFDPNNLAFLSMQNFI